MNKIFLLCFFTLSSCVSQKKNYKNGGVSNSIEKRTMDYIRENISNSNFYLNVEIFHTPERYIVYLSDNKKKPCLKLERRKPYEVKKIGANSYVYFYNSFVETNFSKEDKKEYFIMDCKNEVSDFGDSFKIVLFVNAYDFSIISIKKGNYKDFIREYYCGNGTD